MTPFRKILAFGYLLVAYCPSSAADSKHGYSLIAGRDERCAALASIANGERRRGYSTNYCIGHFSPLKHELAGSVLATRVRDFDFDNDGVPDQVYFREEYSTYQQATIWYVFRGPLSDVRDLPRDLATLTVYPCQFDMTVRESRSCAPFSQDADEATLEVAVEGSIPTVLFRARYTYARPVFVKRKTLLLLTSASLDTREYAAAIEPTGNRTFRALCIFKRPMAKEELYDSPN